MSSRGTIFLLEIALIEWASQMPAVVPLQALLLRLAEGNEAAGQVEFPGFVVPFGCVAA